MSSKRKTASSSERAPAKADRASRIQAPGPATPRGFDGQGKGVSELGEVPGDLSRMIARNIRKFDIGSFPYTLLPRARDAVSTLFQPEQKRDFTALRLKPNHEDLPLRIDGWGTLFLESFNPLASRLQDFLVTIAEPTSRPSFIHEYRLTIHSLYAAVSVGLDPQDIINTLNRFLKSEMPPNIVEFIMYCGRSYGKVKLVLRDNKYFVETMDPEVLRALLQDPVIRSSWVQGAGEITASAPKMAGLVIAGTKEAAGVREAEGLIRTEPNQVVEDHLNQRLAAQERDDDDDQDTVYAFQIRDDEVSAVAERCLALHYPALEEYDFRNDYANPDLEINLRPEAQIRQYQEKSLSKMFGNGRARSGIIVLPCGAGKTLVGITAACTVRKGVVVLATSNMSALQWKAEFVKWTNINPDDVAIFSSDNKSVFTGNTGIIITTYSMVTNARERAHESTKMMQFLQGREWGLMLLDEVHVVPAQMFRRVTGTIKSHSKLGLTATLLREDEKIEDLNFLIGPKLYEANWMELSQQGFIATVQCAVVWCAMPTEFYEHYLQANARSRSIFCVMNPSKFQACQYLIRYHENRGDKIIVFSDDVYALETYARKLMKPYLHGGTSNAERQQILDFFRNSPQCSTLFLSKIGDTSLDLPEATCLIQISAQYGSRRQEAQRLGRVLRAKRRSEEGFNAFFYSLVSKDTVEMGFSSKRQAFLVDQGYAFKVITHLKGIESTPDLAFGTPESQDELLQKILADVDNKARREEEETAALLADGNVFYGPDGRPLNKDAKKRTMGGSKVLRGGQDRSANKSTTGRRTKKKKKVQQNPFFQAMARENERRRKRAREA